MGVAQATISRIEAGLAAPDVFTFNRIAEALGESPDRINELVVQGVARTEGAAAGAGAGAAGQDVISSAVALAGLAGLAALAAFAVAALFGEDDDEPTPRRRKKRKKSTS